MTVGQLSLAGLSAIAAGIHAWVVPEHYEEYALFGVFFAVFSIAQVGWAAAVLRRPTRLLHVAGIALSAGLLAFGHCPAPLACPSVPRPGAEPVELLDVAAGVAELGIIVVSALSLRRVPA